MKGGKEREEKREEKKKERKQKQGEEMQAVRKKLIPSSDKFSMSQKFYNFILPILFLLSVHQFSY